MLIFEQSQPQRENKAQAMRTTRDINLPANLLRPDEPVFPRVSELQAVRHFTRLSQRNFSIDTHFYPLGSCTMKYNPRASNKLAMLPGMVDRHPLTPAKYNQGLLACLYDLQEMLREATGMSAVSLTPLAGAQGEYTGVAMIKAYHDARGDTARCEILVPDAAHGTNPATATMCGYKVREIPTGANGDVDISALKDVIGPQTAGLMLTNPSTLGVFDRNIVAIAKAVHEAGGLLYYDGANLNAILGKVRPADMGFDVVHINLHKTFSTPHGGGGPGAGPVAVSARLKPYLPVPLIEKNADDYVLLGKDALPETIGRMTTFLGNVGILLRAYVYARILGREGMQRVAEFATLNANYLAKKLAAAGFELAYPDRRATHEFIVTLRKESKESGANTMDFAKRLLDYGFHAPTTYFPLLVPECLLIEPTETEDKDTLDAFVTAMIAIRQEMLSEPEKLQQAPYTMPVRRLDDVRAAKQLDLRWTGE